ncbi:hypothetical protein CR513_49920, partial [Mucuna pruriens]
MLKKEQEGFKEYAQRWCKLAAQVQLLITKREMVTMFIDTLPTPYYDKVVGNVASNFVDLVVVGERIDNASFAKKPVSEKKKGETNIVLVNPVFPQGKANAPSYPTQIHIKSRSAAAYTNSPLVPYIPPYQSQIDAGAATSSRLAEQGTRRQPRTLAPNSHAIYGVAPLFAGTKASPNNPSQALGATIPEELRPQCQLQLPLWGHRTRHWKMLELETQSSRPFGWRATRLPGLGRCDNKCNNHKNRDEDEGANRREEEENVVESALVVYIEGNGNPHPNPLIIHYNSASKPRVPFIIQVPTKPV